MPDFNDLIANLELFNRKERFHLLNLVSGGATFHIDHIDPSFTKCLGNPPECPDIPNDPCKVFVAMDYHLDWLHVAIDLAKNPTRHPQRACGISNRDDLFGGTQQDIDMFIAFDHNEDTNAANRPPTTHLILIEAKADTE